MDRQWINRAEHLWHHPTTQQYVAHAVAMADEQCQDDIRARADWRLTPQPAPTHPGDPTPPRHFRPASDAQEPL